MKPVSGKRMCQVLRKRGWTLLRVTGSHHLFEPPGGRGDPVSVPVHSNKDLAPATQRNIMRTAGLTDTDL
jgi:predicted RNA binding protein YcfA (HicA-like mRNA interferase family)